jgi:predicted Fe-Mo cluster-binding NifX family protein
LNDYFLWVDQEGDRVEVEPNSRRFSAKGVGEIAARRIAEQGAPAVITGSITAQAAKTIRRAGIKV